MCFINLHPSQTPSISSTSKIHSLPPKSPNIPTHAQHQYPSNQGSPATNTLHISQSQNYPYTMHALNIPTFLPQHSYSHALWDTLITFFHSQSVPIKLLSSMLCPSFGISQSTPTTSQWLPVLSFRLPLHQQQPLALFNDLHHPIHMSPPISSHNFNYRPIYHLPYVPTTSLIICMHYPPDTTSA